MCHWMRVESMLNRIWDYRWVYDYITIQGKLFGSKRKIHSNYKLTTTIIFPSNFGCFRCSSHKSSCNIPSWTWRHCRICQQRQNQSKRLLCHHNFYKRHTISGKRPSGFPTYTPILSWKKKKAGYTAIQIACRWAEAVTREANQAFRQEQWREKRL